MEKTTLQVTFPEEKLEPLRFYMADKELKVEDELQAFMDSLYEKFVPAATRRYLDRNDEPVKKQKKKQDEGQKRDGMTDEKQVAPNRAGHEKRQVEKGQNAEQQEEATNLILETENQEEGKLSGEKAQGVMLTM